MMVVNGDADASTRDDDDRLGTVYASVDGLIDYATTYLGLDARDAYWARNAILTLFSLDSYRATAAESTGPAAPLSKANPDAALAAFVDVVVSAGLCGEDDVPHLEDAVMGLLSARPSTLQDHFATVERESGGMAAMRWFYDYCCANTYVKRTKLSHNPRFESHGLVITINLAKPEFKNMKKAAAGNSVSGGYPKCTICHENEGFAGRDKRTLRTIPLTLGGTPFFWQFSPYGYFDQHGICVNAEHTPMHVDRDTFVRLLDFVDRFPGYFLGCNAALPRIGGSVLTHDHYQGGGELMPMHKAKAWEHMRLDGFDDADIEILDWPGTAVRVVSRSRRSIVELSDCIREGWTHYTNRDLDIVCAGGDGRRSAVSPSAVVTSRGYEMNLILRNNGVSERYPEGIFHAHPQFWAIKQEPIGLIEAQGLFVLPGRLVSELKTIEDVLAAGGELPDDKSQFSFEFDELRAKLNGSRQPDDVHAAVRDELGSVCERILGNTAVFKDREDTVRFLQGLGFAR